VSNLVATARSIAVVLTGLALLLSQSSCGYRLAGTAELPPELQSLQLLTSGLSEAQRRSLERSLGAAGAQLVDDTDAEAARLNVSLGAPRDQRLVTSGSSGAIVVRISRSLSFDLKAADGTVIAPAQTLRQQRDVSLDDDNLLSSERERDNAVLELEQALYQQLIRQLTRI
jgi:LPS-assembly lipoprotein